MAVALESMPGPDDLFREKDQVIYFLADATGESPAALARVFQGITLGILLAEARA